MDRNFCFPQTLEKALELTAEPCLYTSNNFNLGFPYVSVTTVSSYPVSYQCYVFGFYFILTTQLFCITLYLPTVNAHNL
jgi:hypothetical protein